jgi:hypothetical protein
MEIIGLLLIGAVVLVAGGAIALVAGVLVLKAVLTNAEYIRCLVGRKTEPHEIIAVLLINAMMLIAPLVMAHFYFGIVGLQVFIVGVLIASVITAVVKKEY